MEGHHRLLEQSSKWVYGAPPIGNLLLTWHGYGTAQVNHGGSQNTWDMVDR